MIRGDLTLISGSWRGLAAKPSPLLSGRPLQEDGLGCAHPGCSVPRQQPLRSPSPLSACACLLCTLLGRSHGQRSCQCGRGYFRGCVLGVVGLSLGVETAVHPSRGLRVSTLLGSSSHLIRPACPQLCHGHSHLPRDCADTESPGYRGKEECCVTY